MVSPESNEAPLWQRARKILDSLWSEIEALGEAQKLRDELTGPDLEDVRRVCASPIKSYHYVLPTQLSAKVADPSLDTRCLQIIRGGRGAFDARTVAHKAVVPFDQANNNVLGGSPEPYVNNPLRFPEITRKYRDAQRTKEDWDALCRILQRVEDTDAPAFTTGILKQVLIEICRQLAHVAVAYPFPRRVSLQQTMTLIDDFLSITSYGDRLLALTSAVFATSGKRFALFNEVRRANVTASDASTGMSADLECLAPSGEVILSVEVKDRQITITQLKDKMQTIRQRGISEVFFVAQKGIPLAEKDEIEQLIRREFTAGHNVYVTDLNRLAEAVLALLGEDGRTEFLREVARQLDRHSRIEHRRAWAELLKSTGGG